MGEKKQKTKNLVPFVSLYHKPCWVYLIGLHHNSFTKIAYNYFKLACKNLNPLPDISLEAFLPTIMCHSARVLPPGAWEGSGKLWSLSYSSSYTQELQYIQQQEGEMLISFVETSKRRAIKHQVSTLTATITCLLKAEARSDGEGWLEF